MFPVRWLCSHPHQRHWFGSRASQGDWKDGLQCHVGRWANHCFQNIVQCSSKCPKISSCFWKATSASSELRHLSPWRFGSLKKMHSTCAGNANICMYVLSLRKRDMTECFIICTILSLSGRAILRFYRDNGNRGDRQKTRLLWLIEELGMDRFKAAVSEEIAALKGLSGPYAFEPTQEHTVEWTQGHRDLLVGYHFICQHATHILLWSLVSICIFLFWGRQSQYMIGAYKNHQLSSTRNQCVHAQSLSSGCARAEAGRKVLGGNSRASGSTQRRWMRSHRCLGRQVQRRRDTIDSRTEYSTA